MSLWGLICMHFIPSGIIACNDVSLFLSKTSFIGSSLHKIVWLILKHLWISCHCFYHWSQPLRLFNDWFSIKSIEKYKVFNNMRNILSTFSHVIMKWSFDRIEVRCLFSNEKLVVNYFQIFAGSDFFLNHEKKVTSLSCLDLPPGFEIMLNQEACSYQEDDWNGGITEFAQSWHTFCIFSLETWRAVMV